MKTLEPDLFYHIYTHANGNENLFRTDENYRFFLERYAKHITGVADTYCYCLMPNHLHLMVRIKPIETFQKLKTFGKLYPISKPFANLFSSYTQSYNKVYHRKGSLFIPNFRRKEITDEAGFTKIIHYIHANPVHHGFVKKIEEWRWSSYHSLLSGKPTLLKRQEVLEWFGGKSELIEFHRQPVDVKLSKSLELWKVKNHPGNMQPV